MKYLIIFIVFLFNISSSFTQTNISRITIKYGLVENFQDDQWSKKYGDLDKMISFPELSIGGNLSTDYLLWSVYWGHWNDGITEPILQIIDHVTYSSSANILGIRLFLSSNILKFDTPICFCLFTGYSHHFVNNKPVGGHGIDGRGGEEYNSSFNTAEIGSSIGYNIFKHFQIFGEFERYIPVNGESQNLNIGKNSYRLGLSYIF